MFSSQTRARAVNTRLALSTFHKGNMLVAEYVEKMRSLGDEMATVGRPLEDDELVEYILTGLDHDYDSLVSAVLARVESISVSELYSQMLAFETWMDLRNNGNSSESAANIANHEGIVVDGLGMEVVVVGIILLHNAMVEKASIHINQIMSLVVTIAALQIDQCAKFVSNLVTLQIGVGIGMMRILLLTRDMLLQLLQTPIPWTQSGIRIQGATDHITGELDKLSFREKYNGGKQIHTANGSGMDISHVGKTTIHT